jgi:hypothetical protein
MPSDPEYEFKNLPGYRQLTDEEVAAYEEYVEVKIVPLLNKQELDKEQEAAKVATLLTD